MKKNFVLSTISILGIATIISCRKEFEMTKNMTGLDMANVTAADSLNYEVIITGTNYMTSNNIKSGAQIWQYAAPEGNFITGPIISGNHMFFATTNNIYKVRIDNKDVQWQTTYDTGTRYTHDIKPLSFCRNSLIVTSTSKSKNRTVSSVAAIDTSTGKMIWKRIFALYDTANQATSAAVYNGNLFIGIGKFIVCLNGNSGNILWSRILSARSLYVMPPSVVDGVVYTGTVTNIKDTLYALSATNGSIIWNTSLGDDFAGTYKTFLSTPVVYNQQVMINGHSKVKALNTSTGNENWELTDNKFLTNDIIKPITLSTEPLGSYYLHFTNVSGRIFYTVSSNGSSIGYGSVGYYDGYISNASPVAVRIYDNNDVWNSYFIHTFDDYSCRCETSGQRNGTLWYKYTTDLILNIVLRDEFGNVYYSSDSGMQQ